jgi:hypothetical protein
MRSVRFVSTFKRVSLKRFQSILLEPCYPQESIGFIWEFPNPEKVFPELGILEEEVFLLAIEPVSGKEIGLLRVNMGDSLTVSLPGLPPVIGRESWRHQGRSAMDAQLAIALISIGAEMH